MKHTAKPLWRGISALCTAALLLGLSACEVKKTEEGRAPDVDVDVKADPGKLPKYEVDAADVDVKTKEEKVLVPKVVMEEQKINVPDVDVTMPSEKSDVPPASAPAPEPAPAPAPANP